MLPGLTRTVERVYVKVSCKALEVPLNPCCTARKRRILKPMFHLANWDRFSLSDDN